MDWFPHTQLDLGGFVLTVLPFAIVVLIFATSHVRRSGTADDRDHASSPAGPGAGGRAALARSRSLLTPQDLDASEFKWSHASESDSRILGKPDYAVVDRREGWEILYLANRYVADRALGRDDALRVLRGILMAPSEYRTRIQLESWLDAHGYGVR